LGLTDASYTIQSAVYGKWYTQYTASTIGRGTLGGTYTDDFVVNYLYALSQKAPITWDAVY
jgi:hypothetical protein